MTNEMAQDKPARIGRRVGGGAPKGNQNRRTHGYHHLKLKLTDVSLAAISRQNGIGKAVVEKAETIIADRGGREALSELQLDLVDRDVKTELLIASIDRWLFQQKSLIHRRKK